LEQAPVTTDASAGSSPAPVDSSTFLANLPAKDREAFFEGSPEARSKHAAAPAESATAEPVEQAASTDASPAASETAQPAKKKGLEARSADVDLQIADLKRKLEIKQELERQLDARPAPKQDAKTDPSPAVTTKADWERLMEHPDAPNLDTIGDYDKWVAAMSVFTTSQLLKESRAADTASARQRQEQHQYGERIGKAHERVAAYREKNPEAQLDDTLAAIVPVSQLPPGSPVRPHNFVMEQVLDSEVPGELLMHFSEHPEVFKELLSLSPEAIVRRVGRIEASLSPSSERDTPSPKVVPEITDLPVSVRSRNAATVSDTDTAVRNGDFPAYERAWQKERFGA